MKTLNAVAVLAVASITLSGCAGLPLGGGAVGSTDWGSVAKDVALDPNCGHTDTLNVILGPVPSGSIFLQRQCPGPKAPPLAVGTIVAPAAPAVPGAPPSS